VHFREFEARILTEADYFTGGGPRPLSAQALKIGRDTGRCDSRSARHGHLRRVGCQL